MRMTITRSCPDGNPQEPTPFLEYVECGEPGNGCQRGIPAPGRSHTRLAGELNRRDLDIIEVGCGTGWFCPLLAKFGRVIGTDLSDEVLARAQQRWPGVGFMAGDFASLPLKDATFDVVVSLEVLSHVADQPSFIARIAQILRPGGLLLLATQNRAVLSEHCLIPPPAPGQLRNWVDHQQLRS